MKGTPLTSIVASMKFGNFYATGFDSYLVTDSLSKLTKTYTVTLPKHPQAATRGSFCNVAPYSEYTLNLGPFGAINLDTAAIANATTLNIKVYEDILTGQGRATVYTAGGNELANVCCQWGVPLKVFSTSTISAGGLLSMGVNAVRAIAAPSFSTFTSAVGSIMDAASGVVSSTGANGAATDHLMAWTLDAKFYTIADEDNTNNGRPLCAVSTPSTLTGYMVAQKGLVASSAATRDELDAINAYVEGGFYYE